MPRSDNPKEVEKTAKAKQSEFKNDGSLTVNCAKRYSAKVQAKMLGVISSWPIQKVKDERGLDPDNHWAVIVQNIRIIPFSEPAKRFFIQFWNGHDTPEKQCPTDGDDFEAGGIILATKLMDAHGSFKIDQTGQFVIFSNDEMEITVGTGPYNSKEE